MRFEDKLFWGLGSILVVFGVCMIINTFVAEIPGKIIIALSTGTGIATGVWLSTHNRHTVIISLSVLAGVVGSYLGGIEIAIALFLIVMISLIAFWKK